MKAKQVSIWVVPSAAAPACPRSHSLWTARHWSDPSAFNLADVALGRAYRVPLKIHDGPYAEGKDPGRVFPADCKMTQQSARGSRSGSLVRRIEIDDIFRPDIAPFMGPGPVFFTATLYELAIGLVFAAQAFLARCHCPWQEME